VAALDIRLSPTEGLHEQEVLGLLEVAAAVAGVLDPQRVGQLAVDWARHLLEVDGAHLWIVDSDTKGLRSLARNDPSAPTADDESRGQSIVGQVFSQRKAIVVDDYQGWEHALRAMAGAGVASAMGVPLLVNDRPLGVMVVHNYRPRTFEGREVHLLELFAALVAPALEAARLYSETERRRAEAEVLSVSLAEGLCAVDSRGTLTFANPAAAKLLGWDQAELLGREFHSCVHLPHDASGTVCPLEQTLRSASAVRVEDDEFLRRDGRPIPTSYSASAIIINEEPAGMVVAFRDQTHRRQNEQRIRSLNAELEQRVLERTAELEAANGELEAFSYSVSHDLRAPLRSIDGFCQVLIEDYTDRLDASGKDYLQRVRTASQRMAELIDGLLDLSRVTRATMSREPVDLTDLAASVVAELTRAKRDRTVTFEVQEGLQATGDARLLRLLVDNLLNNAWKFTSKHETARIEFGSTTLDGRQVFFVRDDGAGFEMAYANKLFGPFQRLHGAHEFEGTGIGLATVQRIVSRHGGKVWAEGEAEQGACFYFTL